MKFRAMMLMALVLSGCGTVQTVVRDDQVAGLLVLVHRAVHEDNLGGLR